MKMLFILCLLVFALTAEKVRAFYSVEEVKTEALRAQPGMKINTFQTGTRIRFVVGLLKGDNPAAYWLGNLHLEDERGSELGSIGLRGEDCRQAISEDLKEWQKFRIYPAEVFQFTVDVALLAHSRFSWELGPRNDEHGFPHGGGIVRWCSLQTLLEASEKPKKNGAADPQPAK